MSTKATGPSQESPEIPREQIRTGKYWYTQPNYSGRWMTIEIVEGKGDFAGHLVTDSFWPGSTPKKLVNIPAEGVFKACD